MPLYEYQCSQCGKRFDVLQSIAADPLDKCIHCQGRVQKLVSAPSFQFKGGGFYITDYKQRPDAPAKTDAAADAAAPVAKKEAKERPDAGTR